LAAVVAVICLGVSGSLGRGLDDSPGDSAPHSSTHSSTQPAKHIPDGVDQIKQNLADLSSDDPAVRSDARDALMRLSVDDPASTLERLLAQVKLDPGLSPQQISQLRNVVVQAALIEDHRFAGQGDARLGVILTRDDPQGVGTVVGQTIPGADSFRALRSGDTILTIAHQNDGVLGPPSVVTQREELISFLETIKPGDWVQLRIIRDGWQLDVQMRTWASSSAVAQLGPNEAAVQIAFQRGLERWEKDFLPLLPERVSR
jgi:hypothetical protein